MKNKIGSIVLSVAVAFGLWLYVITAVSPGSKETYNNIPVILEGESVLREHGLMITYQSTSMVSVSLSGNRSDLSKVDSRNIIVKVDLSKIYEPGSQIPLTYNPTFPGNVASNAFVIESKYPETLYVAVERRMTKDVPVSVKWIGSAPEGFITDRENRILDFPMVNIVGPESVVNQIEKAVIEVDLNDQRESISQDYHYTLCDADDAPVNAELITTNVEEIHLDVKIHRVRDLPLIVNLVEGGGAKASNTEVSLSVDTIRISGSDAALSQLGEQLVIGTINLADITKNTTVVFPIVLPEGVTNRTGVTEVEAEVKLNGLSSKELTITQMEAINVPEGMAVDFITEKLTLVVRGPAAQIARLTTDQITILVDFAGAEIGTSTFRAIVRFADCFDGVGALRIDSVSASVAVMGEE